MSSTLSDDISDYCFIDTETKALPHTAGTPDESVTDCGAYRYARGARVIMVQYAIGDGPVSIRAFKDFDVSRRFVWAYGYMDEALIRFWERAKAGKAWFVAWNMAFDRLMLNTIPHCVVRPEMAIDAMAQALASNLPGKLEGASRFIGRGGKQNDGKNLIKLFTGADGWHVGDSKTWVGGEASAGATPQTHPAEWARFKSYGGQDIDELRAVFKATRPLSRQEWGEYWVSERINDRGMAVDVDFCYRADLIAQANQQRLSRQLTALTDKKITAPTQRERIAQWLYDRCRSGKARDTLVKTWQDEEEGSESDELVAGKLSVAEERLSRYIAFFEQLDEQEGLTDAEYELLQIAYARSFGASATPAKFGKILDRHDDGRLKGQYRFNGAQQTGRFSSVDVQIHNLIRASLTDKEHPGREVDAIDFINQLEID